MQKRISWVMLAALVVAVAWTAGARAEEQAPTTSKATGVTGTWKWSTTWNDRTMESTLKLQQAGDKLTGVMISGRNNTETPITEGTVKGDEIAFTVTRTMGDREFTSKYTGKVTGDTIVGQVETQRGTRDWEAKRATDDQKAEEPKPPQQ